MPGQAARVYEVRSSYFPGLTTAYLQGGTPLATSGGDLPLEVSAQLEKFMSIDQRYQVRLTIGPRFSPALPKATIAKAWKEELAEVKKLLDAAEPESYRRLDAIAATCAVSLESKCLSTESEKFLKLPRRGLLKEIAEAWLSTFNQ